MVKLSLFKLGLRWLCQRSRHCLPVLSEPENSSFISVAIVHHFFSPFSWTRAIKAWSSYLKSTSEFQEYLFEAIL